MTNLTLLSTKLDQLILYRDILEAPLAKEVYALLSNQEAKTEKNYYHICHQLIDLATEKNLTGDLWKQYLLYLIITDKNAFSLSSERREEDLSDSLFQAALHDVEILQELYELDFTQLGKELQTKPINLITDFSADKTPSTSINERLAELNQAFSSTSKEELVANLISYYHTYGTGKMGIYKTFRLNSANQLTEITNPDPITFKDLMNYQTQKEKLINNTKALLNDKPANNVLLYGDRGTGKSSSVKALVNEFADQGLRLIEIAKHQLNQLPELLEKLKDRGLYFIIFLDDLSFEDFETEYKYIKAIIEGRVEVKPDNILFYATSNRRHLIKETWEERSEERGEVHAEDGLQEKLSLADRFGLNIKYDTPTQKEYLKIVRGLANKYNIELSREELESKAKQWAIWYNGRSGRTAQQFINHLLGEEAIQTQK